MDPSLVLRLFVCGKTMALLIIVFLDYDLLPKGLQTRFGTRPPIRHGNIAIRTLKRPKHTRDPLAINNSDGQLSALISFYWRNTLNKLIHIHFPPFVCALLNQTFVWHGSEREMRPRGIWFGRIWAWHPFYQ